MCSVGCILCMYGILHGYPTCSQEAARTYRWWCLWLIHEPMDDFDKSRTAFWEDKRRASE